MVELTEKEILEKVKSSAEGITTKEAVLLCMVEMDEAGKVNGKKLEDIKELLENIYSGQRQDHSMWKKAKRIDTWMSFFILSLGVTAFAFDVVKLGDMSTLKSVLEIIFN